MGHFPCYFHIRNRRFNSYQYVYPIFFGEFLIYVPIVPIGYSQWEVSPLSAQVSATVPAPPLVVPVLPSSEELGRFGDRFHQEITIFNRYSLVI